MNRTLALYVVLCLILILPALTCCAEESAPKKSAFAHEQQYLVNSIGKSISNIVLFAAKRQQANVDLNAIHLETTEVQPPSRYSYKLTWGDAKDSAAKQIDLTEYIWSPNNYSDWAQQLLQQFKLKPELDTAMSPSEQDAINKLSEFTTKDLAKFDNDLSASLCEHPLNPALQEEAALLCSVWALRDRAGCFTDLRPWLNRISAHLACARALKGKAEFGPCGQLAECTLCALSGRQSEALSQIKTLDEKTTVPNFASWLRAIRMRATDDYRLANDTGPTLIEELERRAAIASAVDSDRLSSYLDKKHIAPQDIDTIRIGSRGHQVSVEAGHIYTRASLPNEVKDATEDMSLYGAASKDLLESLNAPPTDGLVNAPQAKIQVISWGDLADFHQREIVDSAYRTFDFLNYMLGVKDEAESLRRDFESKYGNLALYPFCALNFEIAKNVDKVSPTLSRVMKHLMLQHPEYVNAALWTLASKHSEPDAVPAPGDWYSPLLPFGTAFDYVHRKDDSMDLATLESLQKIAPYHKDIVWDTLTKAHGKGLTGDQLKQGLGARIDYDSQAMWWLARQWESDSLQYAQSLESYAKFDPAIYTLLAEAYVEAGLPEKALPAYEKGFALNRDSVTNSQRSDWLINYYYDHKQEKKALELGKTAAEVYSIGGLNAMGHLCERMNQLDEAEKYFQAGNERYDAPAALCAFYLRNADKKPDYAAKSKPLLTRIFPSGVKRIEMASLNGPPTFGLKVLTANGPMKRTGLKDGDVIVGVMGYEVRDMGQYRFGCETAPGFQISFTAWDGKSYKTLSHVLPERRFGGGEMKPVGH